MPSDLETLMEAMAQGDRKREEMFRPDTSPIQGSANFYSSARPPKGARVKFTPAAPIRNSIPSSQAD
jgi:hypothetical protein